MPNRVSYSLLFLVLAAVSVSAAAQSYRVFEDSVERIVPGEKGLPPNAPDLTIIENGLTWNLFFQDITNDLDIGFDDPTEGPDRIARVVDCVEYISQVLNETGELDLLIDESFLDPVNPPPGSFLARGGTGFDCATVATNGWAFERVAHGGEALGRRARGADPVQLQF